MVGALLMVLFDNILAEIVVAFLVMLLLYTIKDVMVGNLISSVIRLDPGA